MLAERLTHGLLQVSLRPDAEGCFLLSILRSDQTRVGWVVTLAFKITLHKKDKALLEQLKNSLGVGSVYQQGSEALEFRVKSVKDLQVILDHFERYPLRTKKRADYELFKQAYVLILNKEHITTEGIGKIVEIKASMNRGLSDKLKAAFPKILPVTRPSSVLEDCQIQYPNWFAGFVAGEGCFLVSINNSADNRLGFQVKLVFKITQHSRDEQLMRSLVVYLGCGKYYPRSGRDSGEFIVSSISDITDKIIPFFQNFPIQGVKCLDYLDWCKVAELMKYKAHLTQEGLDQIRKIKAGMNRGRLYGNSIVGIY